MPFVTVDLPGSHFLNKHHETLDSRRAVKTCIILFIWKIYMKGTPGGSFFVGALLGHAPGSLAAAV